MTRHSAWRHAAARPAPAVGFAPVDGRLALSGALAAVADPPGGAVATDPVRGARILLAEDNPVNRQFAVAILVGAGARVDEAYDGLQALESITPGQYDLVLLDILMPGMSGLEVTRSLRRRPEFAGLPILALTALDSDADGDECRAAGIDERIVKPIRAGPLLEAVARWLRCDRR